MTKRLAALSALPLLLTLSACSGADGGERQLPEESRSDLGLVSPIPADPPPPAEEEAPAIAACKDGDEDACVTGVAENAGYVLCAPGARVCSRGQWSGCVTHSTSGPVSGWEPTSVGCAPQACGDEVVTRACFKQLPPTSYTANCYHGTQTCSAGYWGPCEPL
jgi:hypothetical protein